MHPREQGASSGTKGEYRDARRGRPRARRRLLPRRLGWPLSGASEEDIAFFRTGGVVLALCPREALAEDVGVDPAGVGFPGFTLAHNVADRDKVDSTLVEAACPELRPEGF